MRAIKSNSWFTRFAKATARVTGRPAGAALIVGLPRLEHLLGALSRHDGLQPLRFVLEHPEEVLTEALHERLGRLAADALVAGEVADLLRRLGGQAEPERIAPTDWSGRSCGSRRRSRRRGRRGDLTFEEGRRRLGAPTPGPSPGSRCSASAGTPASCSSRTAVAAISGVCSAGLAMTALPAASAAVTCPQKIASGKFQGEMQANTPRPCSAIWLRSPVGPGSASGSAKSARARCA